MVDSVFLRPISRLFKNSKKEGKVESYRGKRELLLLAQYSAWLNPCLVNLFMNGELFL